jgi:hypothetical protein
VGSLAAADLDYKAIQVLESIQRVAHSQWGALYLREYLQRKDVRQRQKLAQLEMRQAAEAETLLQGQAAGLTSETPNAVCTGA